MKKEVKNTLTVMAQDHSRASNNTAGDSGADTGEKVWHRQHDILLKEWGEVCSGYRWLHSRSFEWYSKLNISLTLPVIILSTIAGTANFAQSSLTGDAATYAPICIGAVNLVAGLITTVAQFLRVSQLSESHRVSSVLFGKVYRTIKTELALPYQERHSNGREFLRSCRNEMDRLTEQAALIPVGITHKFERKFGAMPIYRPEILDVREIYIYKQDPFAYIEKATNCAVDGSVAGSDGGSDGDRAAFFNYTAKKNKKGKKAELLNVDSTGFSAVPTNVFNKEDEEREGLQLEEKKEHT